MKTVCIYCGGLTHCFVEMLLRNTKVLICNKGDIVDVLLFAYVKLGGYKIQLPCLHIYAALLSLC